jgi:hypothetical protein
MTRTLAPHVERMLERAVSFVGRRVEASSAVEVREIRPTETMEDDASLLKSLSISELSVWRSSSLVDAPEYLDHLVLMTLGPGRLAVIFTGASRGHGRAASTSVLVNDVLVAADAPNLDSIDVLTYAVRRNQRAERVFASVQDIVDTLNETTNDASALSLSQAVFDRIEVLESAGDAELVLAGRVSALGAQAGVTYVALLSPSGPSTPGMPTWWVRGSSLQVGTSADATVPVTGRSYVLLRYGPRSTQQGVRHYIDELRRKHAVKRDELREGDRGVNYVSYVEQEVDRRTKAVTDALYKDHKMLPVVTPIAIEVAADLSETVALDSKSKSPFQKLLDDAREHLLNEYGTRLPGVRVRVSDARWSPGKYQMMVHEIPVVDETGYAAAGKRLCQADDDELSKIGVYGGRSADHPYTGLRCKWIHEDEWEAVKAAGYPTWEPAEVIGLHLKRILRGNLAEFFGTQEIYDAFALAEKDHFKRLSAAEGGVARFRAAVAALLRERLTVRPLPALADRYLEIVDAPLFDIAEELRLVSDVNRHLLQNVNYGGSDAWRFGNRYSDLIRHSVRQTGDSALAVLGPEVITEIREALPERTDGRPAWSVTSVIVVQDWKIRPFVRAIVERRLPNAIVIAHRELGADMDWLAEGPAAVIGSD